LLRTEQLAVLAILNDESRSDIFALIQHLSEMTESEVLSLIDEVLSEVKVTSMMITSDPIKAAIMRECVIKDRMSRYCLAIEDYQRRGVRTIAYWDSDYPRSLKFISRPPMILYVRGSEFPGLFPIAIVGTRNASLKGLTLSHEFARGLAEKGHTIVSGLALGIDTEAHKGALSCGGKTIAVLAGNVDSISPLQNLHLSEEISGHGALVSEVSMNAFLHRGRFVERNRITSGISEAVVIVEAVKSGGTLHQAKFALSQGKGTYVVDHGEFSSSQAREGFCHLVSIGATPVRTPADLLQNEGMTSSRLGR
jgi:DNA processing protein